jgi:hypothetical protein
VGYREAFYRQVSSGLPGSFIPTVEPWVTRKLFTDGEHWVTRKLFTDR